MSLFGALAPLGEYFTVDRVPDEPSDPPLAELYAGHPALLRYVHQVAVSLHTDEPRVGASILVQGLAARLWSVVAGCALLYDRMPDLVPATTWWAPRRNGGRLRLCPRPDPPDAPDLRAAPEPPSALDLPDARILERSALPHHGQAVYHRVVETHLVGLVAAVQTHVKIPDALLWGNAASALVGSIGVLVRARPDLETAGVRLVEDLFTRPPLAGTGEAPTLTGFVRTSCCLYYRVPGGGLCGDCPLSRQPAG
ncbi:(2Fe-2S)-binding protein [Actinopolymorpha sp. B11F2]|uniref:(2Fe-2S)-binding protein n=1 Tax=Actinopolymorpha sp. B11F2 TaxID=3160862 RepID=UPI0032E3DA62